MIVSKLKTKRDIYFIRYFVFYSNMIDINEHYVSILFQGMNVKDQILITRSYACPDLSKWSLSPWHQFCSAQLVAFIVDVDSPFKGNYQLRRRMEAQAL